MLRSRMQESLMVVLGLFRSAAPAVVPARVGRTVQRGCLYL